MFVLGGLPKTVKPLIKLAYLDAFEFYFSALKYVYYKSDGSLDYGEGWAGAVAQERKLYQFLADKKAFDDSSTVTIDEFKAEISRVYDGVSERQTQRRLEELRKRGTVIARQKGAHDSVVFLTFRPEEKKILSGFRFEDSLYKKILDEYGNLLFQGCHEDVTPDVTPQHEHGDKDSQGCQGCHPIPCNENQLLLIKDKNKDIETLKDPESKEFFISDLPGVPIEEPEKTSKISKDVTPVIPVTPEFSGPVFAPNNEQKEERKPTKTILKDLKKRRSYRDDLLDRLGQGEEIDEEREFKIIEGEGMDRVTYDRLLNELSIKGVVIRCKGLIKPGAGI